MHISKSDITLCSCSYSRDNLSDFPELKAVLPSDYKYSVCNWKRVDDDHFESRFRVNVMNEKEAYLWLEDFCVATNTIFRKEKELPKCKDVVIFSLICNHISREPQVKYKDTDLFVWKHVCPTRLVIVLKLPTFDNEKFGSNYDIHLLRFPMTVFYHQHHNHLLNDSKEDSSAVHKQILKSLEAFKIDSSEKGLSAIKKHIQTPINAVEVELQKSMAKSSGTERQNYYPELQSYKEVLDSLFPHKSAEEENESDFFLPPVPSILDFDIGSIIDFYCDVSRNISKPDESDDMVRIEPDIRAGICRPIEMDVLPSIPLLEIIKAGKLVEIDENMKIT